MKKLDIKPKIEFLRDFTPEPSTKISKYDSEYYDIQIIKETNRRPRFDIRSKKYLMPDINVDIDDNENVEISLSYNDYITLKPEKIDKFKTQLDIAIDFAFNDIKNLVKETLRHD